MEQDPLIKQQYREARSFISGEYDGRYSKPDERPLTKVEVAEAAALGTLAAHRAMGNGR